MSEREGEDKGDFRGNSIIRIKSCKSCELIANLIEWYPVLLTLLCLSLKLGMKVGLVQGSN